ncbi:MAG: 6-pyruvoyl tetrahydropterin synthase family protein, partial [Promethearchaeota archaeon]
MGYKVVLNSTNIKFSACHFLKEPLKCSRLHGHNYYVSVELEAELDQNYFVEDFIKLKRKVKEIIKP